MKRCRHCRKTFAPANSLQVVCSPACAIAAADSKAAKAHARKARAAEKREWRAEHQSIPALKAEAQKAFNAYVRLRDRGKPCISCGKPWTGIDVFGGAWDAGHYRGTGAADHLRFELDNCHLQCKRCNRQLSGNVVAYRQGLIVRIGIERVEVLENNHATVHWTREGLRLIEATFSALARDLRKAA